MAEDEHYPTTPEVIKTHHKPYWKEEDEIPQLCSAAAPFPSQIPYCL
jgi:hypothetical protein